MRPGIERLERAELLGDHQRRVVRQHDAAGADADRARAAGDVPDHHRGRRAGDAGHVVVLGEPEAPVAPALGVLREVERVAERLGRRPALDDRREIEDRKWGQSCVRHFGTECSFGTECGWRRRVIPPSAGLRLRARARSPRSVLLC